MDDYYWKKSGQIPTFGNWDYANDLPITQYFECARQAGLLRYSSSSGDQLDPSNNDLYAVDLKKHTRLPPTKTRMREKVAAGAPHVKEQRKQGRVYDVTAPPSKPYNKNRKNTQNDTVGRKPKAVDEDLYKIPPELLYSPKRKKMAGFLSCLVPACAS